MITLYDCRTAPSPRRARILLAAKGVEHETVEIDLRRGEQLGAAFRALNSQCTGSRMARCTSRSPFPAASTLRR